MHRYGVFLCPWQNNLNLNINLFLQLSAPWCLSAAAAHRWWQRSSAATLTVPLHPEIFIMCTELRNTVKIKSLQNKKREAGYHSPIILCTALARSSSWPKPVNVASVLRENWVMHFAKLQMLLKHFGFTVSRMRKEKKVTDWQKTRCRQCRTRTSTQLQHVTLSQN